MRVYLTVGGLIGVIDESLTEEQLDRVEQYLVFVVRHPGFKRRARLSRFKTVGDMCRLLEEYARDFVEKGCHRDSR